MALSARGALRAGMRRRRRALEPRARAAYAEALARHLIGSPEVRRARRIACYLASDGEIDLAPLIERLWRAGREVWVPALHGARLWFLPLGPETPLALNRFRIAEPALAPRHRSAIRALDLVLVPLVAYDGHGHRLGMGGGFYDRTFSYLRERPAWARPRLLGVGYRFQRVAALEARPWDVPLAAVATEAGIERFTTSAEQ